MSHTASFEEIEDSARRHKEWFKTGLAYSEITMLHELWEKEYEYMAYKTLIDPESRNDYDAYITNLK